MIDGNPHLFPPIGSTQPGDDEDEDEGNEDDSKEDSDGEEHEEKDGGDDILGEEGLATSTTKRKKRQCQSPIKSKWLVPLIKETIVKRPNMSHKECAHLLCLHVREEFRTAMILQNAKMQCRFELFGNPTINAQYTTAMLRETSIRGHKVKSIYKMAADVMAIVGCANVVGH